MFYFYILRSTKDEDLYCGYTSDLKKRFTEHNKGYISSTKNREPFEVVYYEAYRSQHDAHEREQQIKRRAGALISLKQRIKRSVSN